MPFLYNIWFSLWLSKTSFTSNPPVYRWVNSKGWSIHDMSKVSQVEGNLSGSSTQSPDISWDSVEGSEGRGKRWEESGLWVREQGIKRRAQGSHFLKTGSCAGPTPWAPTHFSLLPFSPIGPIHFLIFLSADDTTYAWPGQASVLPSGPSKQTH